MKKKQRIISCLFVITLISQVGGGESWIDYDNIKKIMPGSSRNEVISTLGEPILVLASSEDDNTVYLFYNYHIKNYETKRGLGKNDENRTMAKERTTLIKFIFIDDSLESWEEDKMTLSMSKKRVSPGGGSFLSYFSLLLNLILLIKII